MVGTGNDCLGARAQVDIDEVEREGVGCDRAFVREYERECECDNEETSEKVGETVLFVRPVCTRARAGASIPCLIGVTNEDVVDDMLFVR